MVDVESLKFAVKLEEVPVDQKLDRMAVMADLLKVVKDAKWRIAAIEITDRAGALSIKHRVELSSDQTDALKF